jgi:hypothetical protein
MIGSIGREAPDARCVLCARPKANVRYLVQGVVGSVCSDCVPSCVQALGDKLGDPGASHRSFFLTRKLKLVPNETDQPQGLTVEIDADIAAVFQDGESINAALRPLVVLINALRADDAAEA